MRVCPKCGYMDPPYWRHSWHKRFTDVTRMDDIEQHDPELAAKIKASPRLYDDGLYLYHLSRRGYVVRIWRGEAKHIGTIEEPWHERHKEKLHPEMESKLEEYI